MTTQERLLDFAAHNKSTETLQRLSLYPYFVRVEASDGPTVDIAGRSVVNMAANNYLGLSHHPLVKERAIRAIERYGTACTGSRLLNGNYAVHEELESTVAAFVGQPAALVFSTGLQVNLGVLPALVGAAGTIIIDAASHGSIVQSALLSNATLKRFPHADYESLGSLLAESAGLGRGVLVVAEGLFAVDGEIAQLETMLSLCERYGAECYLDDSHGLGVLGRSGRGTASHFAVEQRLSYHMATLSKAFASNGGFVATSVDAISYLRHHSHTLLYSVAMSPSAAASALACIEVVQSDPDLHRALARNVAFFGGGLRQLGFTFPDHGTPIFALRVGSDVRALRVARALLERDVFALPMISPTVPLDEARVRLSVMAVHTMPQLEQCLDAIEQVARTYEIGMWSRQPHLRASEATR
jgi:8-amino-7-oxononanoate synthase